MPTLEGSRYLPEGDGPLGIHFILPFRHQPFGRADR